jgi:hypothetical protein
MHCLKCAWTVVDGVHPLLFMDFVMHLFSRVDAVLWSASVNDVQNLTARLENFRFAPHPSHRS